MEANIHRILQRFPNEMRGKKAKERMIIILSTLLSYPYQQRSNGTIVAGVIDVFVLGSSIDIIVKALVDVSNEGANSRKRERKI